VPFAQQGHVSKGTVIGNNVLIGSNCVIVDGANIEDNVMIGAQSLVSGKIPKNSVAQGNPAKVIFTRR
jgi:acetyltransferase-like isoleucine patch superfamily enzyme